MAMRFLGNKERKVNIVSVMLKKEPRWRTNEWASFFPSQHQRKISQMDTYTGTTFNHVLW